MEPNFKTLVFDYDNTLTDAATGNLVDSGIAAIKQAQIQGYKLIVDTGRSRAGLSDLTEAGLKPDIIVACYGHVVYNQDGFVSEQSLIPLDPYRDISDFCAAHHIGLFWKFLEGVFVQVDNPELPWNFKDNHGIYYRCQPDPTRSPNGGCLRGTTEQLDFFTKHFHTKVEILHTSENEYDIGIKGHDKQTGLEAALKLLNLEPESCVAFGDDGSDAEMLRYAGLGIAMGDAEATAKEAADSVTDTAAHDGIAKALKKYGIIE